MDGQVIRKQGNRKTCEQGLSFALLCPIPVMIPRLDLRQCYAPWSANTPNYPASFGTGLTSGKVEVSPASKVLATFWWLKSFIRVYSVSRSSKQSSSPSALPWHLGRNFRTWTTTPSFSANLPNPKAQIAESRAKKKALRKPLINWFSYRIASRGFRGPIAATILVFGGTCLLLFTFDKKCATCVNERDPPWSAWKLASTWLGDAKLSRSFREISSQKSHFYFKMTKHILRVTTLLCKSSSCFHGAFAPNVLWHSFAKLFREALSRSLRLTLDPCPSVLHATMLMLVILMPNEPCTRCQRWYAALATNPSRGLMHTKSSGMKPWIESHLSDERWINFLRPGLNPMFF